MIRYFHRSLIGRAGSHTVLLALTVFGVALGVASVLAIQILNRNAIAAVDGTIRAISGEADLSIVATNGGLPSDAFPIVLGTSGVTAAWPLQRSPVTVTNDSDEVVVEIIGVDLFSPQTFPLDLQHSGPADLLRIPAIAVSTALARRHDWSVGDTLVVTQGAGAQTIQIAGHVDFQRAYPTASSRLAIMDIAQAQKAFGEVGTIDQIDVKATPPSLANDLAGRLVSRLGPGVRVVRPGDQLSEASEVLRAFRLNLTALSTIALVVGVFLVYASTQAALLRRRPEFAVLRSLGATRLQVCTLVLVEICLIGLVGVAFGIPLGFVLAKANLATVSATLSNIYLLEHIERLDVPLELILLALATGLAGAVMGGIIPILDISHSHPRLLLAPGPLHDESRRKAPTRAILGSVVIVITGVWYLVGGRQWQPSGFVLASVIVISIPLFVPLLVSRIFARTPVESFGWGLSVRALSARLQTAVTSITALAIAVSVTMGVTIMVGSFRSTLDAWIRTTVSADVYLAAQSGRSRPPHRSLSRIMIDSLRTKPGVRGIDKRRSVTAYVDQRPVRLTAVDSTAPGQRFSMISGTSSLIAEQPGTNVALVSEPFWRRTGTGVSDTVRVHSPTGMMQLVVRGIFYDYGSERGAMFTSHTVLDRYFGAGDPHGVGIYLASDVDVDHFTSALRRDLRHLPVVIRDNRQIRTQALAVFDQTFAVTNLLRVMSLLVAASAIALTLVIMANEHAHDIALYRALGATRPQIFGLYLGKGLGMSATGLAVGMAAGTALAAVLILVINRSFFGWTIAPSVPAAAVTVNAIAILLVAIGASVYPAWMASRTPATELSRETA